MSEAESWKLLMLHARPCSNQFLIGLSSVCSKNVYYDAFSRRLSSRSPFPSQSDFFLMFLVFFHEKKRDTPSEEYMKDPEKLMWFFMLFDAVFSSHTFSYAVCAFDGREVEVYFCVFRVSLGVIRIVRNFKLSFIINAGFSIGWHGFMFFGDMMMFFSHFGLASYVKWTGRRV